MHIPLVIATSDGEIRKCNKSILMQQLKWHTHPLERLPVANKRCAIFYLMTVIQSSGHIAATSSTFGEYSQKLSCFILRKVSCAQHIDIVCDRYDATESIKEGEHKHRAAGSDPFIFTFMGQITLYLNSGKSLLIMLTTRLI